jgi:hypothetical protein
MTGSPGVHGHDETKAVSRMVESETGGEPGTGPYPATPVDEAAVDRLIVTELKEQVLSYFGRVPTPA